MRPRTFDWDAAAAMRREGMTIKQVARHFDVSGTAILNATNTQYRTSRAKALEDKRAPCLGGCGALVWTHRKARTGYCSSCWRATVDFPSAALSKARFFPTIVRHGTEYGYNRHKCRCYKCRAVASLARAERRSAEVLTPEQIEIRRAKDRARKRLSRV